MVKQGLETNSPAQGEVLYQDPESAWNRILFELRLDNRVSRGEKVDVYIRKREDGVVEVSKTHAEGEVRVTYELAKRKRNE